MKLVENTCVSFDEITHTYLMGDRWLTGVTSLMKKHGLSPDYSGIDEATLEHAASLGTAAHKQIEDYCDGKVVEQTPLVKSFAKMNLDVVCCEYLVSDNGIVASSIDMVIKVGENMVDLVDIKRTSTVHKHALSWQLGIYRYLFEMQNPDVKVARCWCLPIQKGNKDDILADLCKPLVEISPVTKDEVETLLECESLGVLYGTVDTPKPITTGALFMSANEGVTLADSIRCIAEYETRIKIEEAKIKDIKARLYDMMLERDVDECVFDGLKIKLKRPYSRSVLDTKGLKADHPDIYADYIKDTETKGSITITLNQNGN